MTPITVEQADRIAAAALCHDFTAREMLAGRLDDSPKVQAFARHRIAERERCAGMVLDAAIHALRSWGSGFYADSTRSLFIAAANDLERHRDSLRTALGDRP